MPEPRPLPDRLAIPMLLIAGLALHLPWMFEPFGFYEINAGYFYGPFAQSWHQFGFFETRGITLGTYEFRATTPEGAFANFNHPPLYSWACALFGTGEWALRLPSTLSSIAAGPLAWALIRPHLLPTPALLAAMTFVAVPAVTFAPQMSFEAPVLAAGLALLLAQERLRAGGPRWRPLLILIALGGPWLDWNFGFWALALWLLAGGEGLRALARRLLLPWTCYGMSLVGVLCWLLWVRTAPFVRKDVSGAESFGQVIGRALGNSPSLPEFVAGTANIFDLAFTAPLLSVSAVGLLFVRRRLRLFLTLLLPPLANILVFRGHACSHIQYAAFAAPLVTLAIGSLLEQLHRLARPVGILAGLCILAAATAATVDFRVAATQPVFRNLGATLTAIGNAPPEAPDPRPVLVATNAEQNYPYYVLSPRVYLFPAWHIETLERVRSGPSRVRYVYLYFERRPPGSSAPPGPQPHPELHAWLERFPKRALPELTGRFWMSDEIEVVIHGAWVYDL